MRRAVALPASTRPSGEVVYLRELRGGQDSDAELVERARAGSMAAKETLYARHARAAFGVAHRILAGDEVEDVVQDAFMAAFERLDQLRDGQAFAAWLFSIVIGKARSRLRKRRWLRMLGLGRHEAHDFESFVSSEGSPEVTTELNVLYGFLNELPVDVGIALVLRRVEGLTVREIGNVMDVSESTAKRHVRAGEVLLEARLARGGTR